MSYLQFKNIAKQYTNEMNQESYAVKNASFEIEKGELVVFVGPSGCGKSTFLRMIAGLEEISSGEMIIDGTTVNEIEVKKRDIAMVFQDYALYPHMTVKQNLAFGLENQRVPKKKITEKVAHACSVLELTHLEDRLPKQLSGGQRQRVALGRALVKDPKVFLLDEPLSNLDAKLRVQTRKMIAALHKQIQATMIYVTHDQVEAMTLGDRIVVMKDGEIQQIDTPENLYKAPKNTFVASFIGTPPMNLLKIHLDNLNQIILANQTLKLPATYQRALTSYQGKEVILGFRPEDVSIEPTSEEANGIKPNLIEFLGAENLVYFELPEGEIIVRKIVSTKLSENDCYEMKLEVNKIHLFDCETGQIIVRKGANSNE